jgi:UDP-3-O-[3-hydroxymyristoyl] glucosamine N-acyltransferase
MARLFKNKIFIREVFELVGLSFNSNEYINGLCSVEEPCGNSICLYINGVLPNKCENLWLLTSSNIDDYNCIVVKNPKYALDCLSRTLFEFEEIVHAVAEDVVIGKNVVIEHNVKIGSGTIIEHGAIILKGSIIGNNCIIQSNSVIGSRSYSFYRDNNGNLTRLPSFGGVVIGSGVEVGANSTIDVGLVDNTYIASNVKIDNLVHIGHDCKIGENATIVAGASLCGYVSVGKNTRVAPNSTIKQRMSIGDDCVVGLGSVVMTNIPDNMSCFGVPAKKAMKG